MTPFSRDEDSSEGRITEAAAEWALEKKEGFAPHRATAFQAWLAADPRHARAWAKAERTLALLGGLPDLPETLVARLEAERPAEVGPVRSVFRRRALLGMIAAAATIVVTAWLRWPAGGREDSSYVSQMARPQQVVLDDGSFVDLNANTVLRTQLLPHERRIALREGEAHFAVAHDAARPFIVEADGVAVRAVGTAFNVRLSEGAVEVLVFEGRVEVSGTAGRVPVILKTQQLGVAERVIVPRADAKSEVVLEKVAPQEIAQARSWHSTVTTISSRPLREVVELFNRRNEVRLVIADTELGERMLGGSFPIGQPQAFVRVLELEGDVQAETRDGEIVLRRKR